MALQPGQLLTRAASEDVAAAGYDPKKIGEQSARRPRPWELKGLDVD